MIKPSQRRKWNDFPNRNTAYADRVFTVDEPGEWTTSYHFEDEPVGSRVARTDFMLDWSETVPDQKDES